MKYCKLCELDKPKANFSWRGKVCDDCRRARMRMRYWRLKSEEGGALSTKREESDKKKESEAKRLELMWKKFWERYE